MNKTLCLALILILINSCKKEYDSDSKKLAGKYTIRFEIDSVCIAIQKKNGLYFNPSNTIFFCKPPLNGTNFFTKEFDIYNRAGQNYLHMRNNEWISGKPIMIEGNNLILEQGYTLEYVKNNSFGDYIPNSLNIIEFLDFKVENKKGKELRGSCKLLINNHCDPPYLETEYELDHCRVTMTKE